jgi:hypothetical protein
MNKNIGKCGHEKCAGGNGELCFHKGKGMRSYDDIKAELNIKARLEYLRGELRAERMSYGELAELQSLAEHIEEGDVELREAAGIPEFEE